jgi:Kef-type K+ transport system membrane component KefB
MTLLMVGFLLGVSYLIASMVMGVVIANVARHHEYPFHAIEGIEWPFMVIFFVLAGASLELSALMVRTDYNSHRTPIC